MIGGLIGTFVNFILFDNPIAYGVCFAIAFLPLIVAAIILEIRNAAINRKVQALPEECRSTFLVKE